MKVIANNHDKVLGIIACKNCRSVLEIHNTDVCYVRRDRAFLCPCCGYEQAFKLGELTKLRNKTESEAPHA